MQAADKKRPREEREILHRLRPFARLQTAEDYEAFAADMLCTLISSQKYPSMGQNLMFVSADEAILRKRIQELQHYRRLGLSTAADIDRYEHDLAKRVRIPSFVTISYLDFSLQTQVKAQARDYDRTQYRSSGRQSSGPDPRRSSLASFGESDDRHSREPTPRLPGTTAPPVRRPRKMIPLNSVVTRTYISDSTSSQSRQQPLITPTHACRTNPVFTASHSSQALSCHQGDSCTGVRP